MTTEEKAITKLVEIATKDRRTLRLLKNVAIKAQNFELASELRTLELEKYPEANTHNDNYKEASSFAGCLLMTECRVTAKIAYKVLAAARAFEKMKEGYDLDTASKIIHDTDFIFGEEEY